MSLGRQRPLDDRLGTAKAPWKDRPLNPGKRSKPLLPDNSKPENWGNFFGHQSPKRPLVYLPTEEVTRIYSDTPHQNRTTGGSSELYDNPFEDFELRNTPCESKCYMTTTPASGWVSHSRTETSRLQQTHKTDLKLWFQKLSHHADKVSFLATIAQQGANLLEQPLSGFRVYIRGVYEPVATGKGQNLVAIIRRTPNLGAQSKTVEVEEKGRKIIIPHVALPSHLPSVEAKLKVTPKQMRAANSSKRPSTTQLGAGRALKGMQGNHWVREWVHTVKDESEVLTQGFSYQPQEKPARQKVAQNPEESVQQSIKEDIPWQVVNRQKPLCILGVAKKHKKPPRRQPDQTEGSALLLGPNNTERINQQSSEIEMSRGALGELDFDGEWVDLTIYTTPFHSKLYFFLFSICCVQLK